MRRWFALLAIVAVGCSQAATAPKTETTVPAGEGTTTTTVDTARIAAWEEDLDHFWRRMVEIHPNPFRRTGEDAFRAEFDELRAGLDTMSDDDVELAIIRLAALIDGHSLVVTSQPALDFDRLQIHTYWFEDGLFITRSANPEVVGGVVTAIGDVPIAEAIERVRPYASHDNEMTIRLVTPLLLANAELLRRLDLATEQPVFTVQTRGGDTIEVEPPVIAADELSEWLDGFAAGLAPAVTDFDAAPLYLSNPGRAFWWTYLEDSGTVYIQMNRVTGRTRDPVTGGTVTQINMVGEIWDFVDNSDVERVVFDLRHNPGGDNTSYGALLRLLSEHTEINQRGRLFVLTSRTTFSAAANLATELDNETEAIFAGEPPGGSPNLYGDVVTMRLPNSGIEVRVSGRYWPFGGPDDTRPWIEPELWIPLTSADFFAGVDPVLDAVLAFGG